MPQPDDRRLARPRISIGSVTGFFTVLIAITTATLWLGNLDRGQSDTVLRVDKLERDNASFQSEMRATLQTISQQLLAVQLLVAKDEGAAGAVHHR